jgi:hypothetical protein
VINIKKGKRLAPGSLDINAATEILSHHQENYNFLLPAKDSKEGSSSTGFLGALQEFGRSYRIVDSIKRYYQLKAKATRSAAEAVKFEELSQTLKSHFNDQNWE